MTKTKQLDRKTSTKRKGRSLDKVKGRNGWLFISPFLIGFVLIYLPMIVESLRFSFGKIHYEATGYVLENVGWDNYRYALFEHTTFVQTLWSSFGKLLFNVPAIVIFSLFVAVLLNQKMRGRAIFRAIFFIPVIVSTGIIEYIETQDQLADAMGQVATGSNGVSASTGGQEDPNAFISVMDVARYFQGMAVGRQLVEYVVNIANSVYDIVNKSGVQIMIFLAGLQSVSPAIYESCQMDGATTWEIFWKITFPMISPMILINAVYTVIDSFTSKENEMMNLIDSVYSSAADGTVQSTAMAWMYFLVIIVTLLLVAAIMGGYVFYQKRDT